MALLRTVAVFSLLMPTILSAGEETNSDRPMARWDRAVFLHSQTGQGDDKSNRCATGFFVKLDENFFLATAAHAARETNPRTRICYRNGKEESRWISMGHCSTENGDPWRCHRESDVALMRIDFTRLDEKSVKDVRTLAIPWDSLCDAPARGTEIEFAGFPLGLGVHSEIAALAIRGHLASLEIPHRSKWGMEPILFATPAVAAGCSGGPVFRTAEDERDCSVLGMYVGVVSDDTGAKLSKLVPARVIKQFVRTCRHECKL